MAGRPKRKKKEDVKIHAQLKRGKIKISRISESEEKMAAAHPIKTSTTSKRALPIRILLTLWTILKTIARFIYRFMWGWAEEFINILRHALRVITGPERLKHLACVISALVFAVLAVLIVSFLFPPAGAVAAALTIGALKLSFAELAGAALLFGPPGAWLMQRILKWNPINSVMNVQVERYAKGIPQKQANIRESIERLSRFIINKLHALSLIKIGNDLRLLDPNITDYERHLAKRYNDLKKEIKKGNFHSVKSFLQEELNSQEGEILEALLTLKDLDIDEAHIQRKFNEYRNKLLSYEGTLEEQLHLVDKWWQQRMHSQYEPLIYGMWRKCVLRQHFIEYYHTADFDIQSMTATQHIHALMNSATSSVKEFKQVSEALPFSRREFGHHNQELENLHSRMMARQDAEPEKIYTSFDEFRLIAEKLDDLPLDQQFRKVEVWLMQQNRHLDTNALEEQLEIFEFWKKAIERENFITRHHLEHLDAQHPLEQGVQQLVSAASTGAELEEQKEVGFASKVTFGLRKRTPHAGEEERELPETSSPKKGA